MRRDVDAAIHRLAGRRSGAFTRDDVTAAGGDKYLVRRRVAAGSWVPWWLDVFTLAAHPSSFDQLRWVAVLAAGPSGHLSFESAAELHGLAGIERGLLAVTTRRANRIEMPGVVFHQLADVQPHHLTVVEGYPTTTVPRTIVDLAAVVGRSRLGASIEDAVVKRLVTFGQLYGALSEVRRPGKPGVSKLVGELDARDGEAPPPNELERHLLKAAAMAGVRVSPQHPLPARPSIVGVVDAAVVESRLILEADGRRWHARMRDMARDRRRDREAARLGWQTLRFMYEDLVVDVTSAADDIAVTNVSRTRG